MLLVSLVAVYASIFIWGSWLYFTSIYKTCSGQSIDMFGKWFCSLHSKSQDGQPLLSMLPQCSPSVRDTLVEHNVCLFVSIECSSNSVISMELLRSVFNHFGPESPRLNPPTMLITLDLCDTLFRNTARMCQDRNYVVDERVAATDFYPSRSLSDIHVGDDQINARVFIRASYKRKAGSAVAAAAGTATPATTSTNSSGSNDAAAAATELTAAPAPPAPKQSQIIAVFLGEEEQSIGIKQMRELVEFASRNRYRRVILLFQREMKAQARQALLSVSARCLFEVFLVPQLLHIVVDHHLVPKHIPLSESRAKEELDCRCIKKNQLPVMRSADPIARYLGLKPGTVVCIVVASNVTGFYIKFRQVK